jgi:hypothetical protein
MVTMPSEVMHNGTGTDIPDSDDIVLGTGGQIFSIRAETNASNVQIAVFALAVVLKSCGTLSSVDIEDLRDLIAAGCNKSTIMTEPDRAYDVTVLNSLQQLDIEEPLDLRIEDGIPVVSLFLEMGRKYLVFKIGEEEAANISRGRRHSWLTLRWTQRWRNSRTTLSNMTRHYASEVVA